MNKLVLFSIASFVFLPPFVQANFINSGSQDIMAIFSAVLATAILATGKLRVTAVFVHVISIIILMFVAYQNVDLLVYNLVAYSIGLLLCFLEYNKKLENLVYFLVPFTIYISIDIIFNSTSLFKVQYISAVRLQIITLLLLINVRSSMFLGLPIACSMLLLGSRLGNLVGLIYIMFILRPYLTRYSRTLRLIIQMAFVVLAAPVVVKILAENARLLGSFNRAFVAEPRFKIYTMALGHLERAPLFGYGYGKYAVLHATYPHNFILQLFEDFGILGLFPVFGVLITIYNANKYGYRMNIVATYLFLLVCVSMDFYKFVFLIGLLFFYIFQYGYFNNNSVVRN